MRKILTTLAALAFAASLATGAAADMIDWDIDLDGGIDTDEYGEYYDDVRRDDFALYDTNQDGLIDEEEFEAAEFDRYDVDDDGILDAQEYGAVERDGGLFD